MISFMISSQKSFWDIWLFAYESWSLQVSATCLACGGLRICKAFYVDLLRAWCFVRVNAGLVETWYYSVVVVQTYFLCQIWKCTILRYLLYKLVSCVQALADRKLIKVNGLLSICTLNAHWFHPVLVKMISFDFPRITFHHLHISRWKLFLTPNFFQLTFGYRALFIILVCEELSPAFDYKQGLRPHHFLLISGCKPISWPDRHYFAFNRCIRNLKLITTVNWFDLWIFWTKYCQANVEHYQ